jgi:hypothetical protein
MTDDDWWDVIEEFDGKDVVLRQGEKIIAKRGPDGLWVPLEPGVAVSETPDGYIIGTTKKPEVH